ncbi:MAG: flagellar assembly protein FliH, partial [Brevinematia bacterium]
VEELNKEIEKRTEELKKIEENIIDQANEKASKIIEEAEKVAFGKIKSSLEEKNLNIQEGEKEKQKIIEEGKLEAQKIIQQAMVEAEQIKKDAYEKGFAQGLEDGFSKGKHEIELLSERLKEIIAVIINKRNEIVNKSEREVVELALEVVKKVLKEIKENERDLVIRQVRYALSKLLGGTKFIIRVNPKDFNITIEHKEEFLKMLESNADLKIFEDPFVEEGGCIVETDTTTIDAQISLQLREIEEKIRSILP